MWKKVLYCIGMAAVLIWLWISTPLIIWSSGALPPKEIDFPIDWCKDPVLGGMDSVTPCGDLAENVALSGWAMVDAELEAPDRYSRCILRGESHCYELQTAGDSYYGRPDLELYFSDKKIPENVAYGLKGNFSLLGVEDGLYKVYLKCWENEDHYGLAESTVWIKKEGSIIEKYEWRAEPCNGPAVTEDAPCIGNIDYSWIEEGTFMFGGIAFAEGVESSQSKTYAELTDKAGNTVYYKTNWLLRRDIGELFNDARYIDSGYSVRFPAEELPDGTYTLRLLVENGGRVWASPALDLQKSK